MGHLYKLIEQHLDEYGVREAELARRIGSSPQTVNSWKKRGIKKPPEQELLMALAIEIRRPYGDVLRAALLDSGYITEAQQDVSEEIARAAFEPGLSADQRRRIIAVINEDRPQPAARPGRETDRQRGVS